MIIKKYYKHIYISKFTYLFLFLAVFSGGFRNVLLIGYLVSIHEIGHFIMAYFLEVEVDKICFYPFGGISKINAKLNIKMKDEFLILIMGPIFQMCGYIFLYLFLRESSQYLLTIYNFSLLIFNFLPIYPLDGGKLLNLVFNLKYSFITSLKLIIYISYLIIILFIAILLKIDFGLNAILLSFVLIYKLIKEHLKIKYYFDKFLLERYIYKFTFHKKRVVNDIKYFKRDYYHTVKYNNSYYTEKDILRKKFK